MSIAKFDCVNCGKVSELKNMTICLNADGDDWSEHYMVLCPHCESHRLRRFLDDGDALRAELAAEREMRKKDISILKQSLACVDGWIEKPLSTYSLLAMENLLDALKKHLDQHHV